MSGSSFSAPAICQSQHSRNYVRKTSLCFLLMLLGLLPGCYFLFAPLLQEGGIHTTADWLIGGGLTGFGLLFLVLSILSLYRWLRPHKGRLGRSVLSQFDQYVDEDEIGDLFRQIDEDVAAGCRIGSVYIGDQWILGEEAMRLERVRGVFGFEPKRGKKGREYTLCLVDTGDHVLTASMSLQDLQAAQDYLLAQLPPVMTGGLDVYSDFIGLSEADKQAFLARQNRAKESPEAPAASPKPQEVRPEPSAEAQAFVYTGPDGGEGHAAPWEEIEEDLLALEPQQSLRLLASEPVPCAQGESLGLLCVYSEEGWYVAAVFRQGKRPLRYSCTLPQEEAVAVFERYYFDRQPPDVSAWEDESSQYAAAPKREGCTLRVDAKKKEQVSFEEVMAALDSLDGGHAHFFLLIRSGSRSGCIAVTREQEKAGYTVGVAQQEEGGSRTFETDTEDRLELQQWLSDYYDHGTLPDTTGWLDKTEEAQQARQKA